MGQIDSRGALIKPYKNSGTVDWYAQFVLLTTANAYTIAPNTYHVMGCGYYTGTNDIQAGIFRVSNTGALQYFISMAPSVGKATQCYGVAFDDNNNILYVYVQSNSLSLSGGSYYDNAILVFD